MVVYHVYSGGQDLVTVVELSVSKPRTKVHNHRTGHEYWVANTHLVSVDNLKAVA